MEEKRSYLDQLQFDPKLAQSVVAKYLTNFRYVLLLIIAITVAGVFSFLNLPRRLNPQVNIPIVSVTTPLLGASPEDVESLITIPIEDKIAGLEGVNTIASTSLDNFSAVSVQFQSGTSPDKAKDNVQSAVDTITNLPNQAKTPNVQKLDFENQPVWTFLITSNQDEASLMRFGENLKDRLERLSSVKQVNIAGSEEEEIQVFVKPSVQKDYNIDPQTISRAIQASIHAQPAGNLNTENSSFALTIDPTTKSLDELRDININVGTQIVKLSDVATISVRSKPNQPRAYYATNDALPQKAITFSVFKTDSANIDKTVNAVKAETGKALGENPNKFNLLTIINLSDEVDKQFSDLLSSFRDTILLVIVVLFLFLGIRQALIVAFCIPLSFLVSFTVMQTVGLTLNFLSLFSLILALGLLVDDAIVVVTATTAYWRSRKFTPNETGLLVLRDFIVPIWSTTITAVWAFLPLLVASGIIGEFIKSISIVVSATLLASTAIAILITLPMMMVFLKPDFPNRVKLMFWFLLFLVLLGVVVTLSLKSPLLPINIVTAIVLAIVGFKLRHQLLQETNNWLSKIFDSRALTTRVAKIMDSGVIDSTKFATRYQNLIDKVLSSRSFRNKTLIIVVVFAIFSYLLLPLGFVTNEFFPKTDQGTLYVSVELPAGTNLDTAEKEAKTLVEDLRKTEGVKYATAETGRSISTEDFFGPQSATNNILFTLVLPDKKERKVKSIEIAQVLRDKYENNYYRGKLSVIEQSSGPPAGADLQIKFLGDDPKALNAQADKVVSYLRSRQAINNIQKSIKSGGGKIVFVPDRVKIAQTGITESELGSQLRTYASGFTLDSNAKISGKEKDIVFRTNSSFQQPESLGSLNIKTQTGDFPLSALGTLEFKPTATRITREDQKRTLSVTAGVVNSKQIAAENKNLQDFATKLSLPTGYEWKIGGVNEENQKSVNSIFQAMTIAFILIAATMVIQFGSYRKAFIILLLIPLAISGVFIVFALTATPLSFPTLIGILALFGIVVYQSMLIVDKIGRNQRAGMYLKHAISDAAASRVEPIMFGTITTVVGLIPITLSDPLWRGLGGAIIAGLLFSGAIMLLFIPVVYYKFYEKEVA
ncbi:MAG: efflux RND transporter permease subunit [Patescibacteria group bacterium]